MMKKKANSLWCKEVNEGIYISGDDARSKCACNVYIAAHIPCTDFPSQDASIFFKFLYPVNCS